MAASAVQYRNLAERPSATTKCHDVSAHSSLRAMKSALRGRPYTLYTHKHALQMHEWSILVHSRYLYPTGKYYASSVYSLDRNVLR